MKHNIWICTLILTMVCLTFVLCGSDVQGNIDDIVMDAPNTLNALEAEYSLDAAKSILGNEDAGGNVELLYNANDEAEYLLVTANEGGYVIFHRMTGSLMEAGEFGSSPYADQVGKKYYFGASNYVVANAQGVKTDIMRGGEITEEQLSTMHQNMVEIRSIVVERSDTKTYKTLITTARTASQEKQNYGCDSRSTDIVAWQQNPFENQVDINAFVEVENSNYIQALKSDDEFGNNTHGSCEFVADVLMLRYHDMFESTAIIPNSIENIPNSWRYVCNNLAFDKYDHRGYSYPKYSCEIQDSDTVYEILHKFLIGISGITQFGDYTNVISMYNNFLPSCIQISLNEIEVDNVN